MRLPTFSFLRNCKLKLVSYQIPRYYSNETLQLTEVNVTRDIGDETYVEVLPSWPAHEEPELRAQVLKDMQIIPNFISEKEEADLLSELEPYLKRMRYEFDHWDNAIQGYRETERTQWSEANRAVLARVRHTAFADPSAGTPLEHAHVLDLAAAGHIRPHVDAVRFCGPVIAGLCLVSSAVMRLQHCQRPTLALDALLARRALYLMRGVARYEFSHAVLGAAHSQWRGEPLQRRRRVAVIMRSRPHSAQDHN